MATKMLDSMCDTSSDGGARLCMGLLGQLFNGPRAKTEHQAVYGLVFYTLTTIQRALSNRTTGKCAVPENLRMELRGIIFRSILLVADPCHHTVDVVVNGSICDHISASMPQFLRTKIGVVLSLLIQMDYPERWHNAFDDLMNSLILSDSRPTTSVSPGVLEVMRKDIFLRTIEGFCDEVVDNISMDRNVVIKDIIRGFKPTLEDSQNSTDGIKKNGALSVLEPPENTISARITSVLLSIFHASYPFLNTEGSEICKLPILAMEVLKRLLSWLDLSLVCNEKVFGILFLCLASAGNGKTQDGDDVGSPSSQLAVKVVECLHEIIIRGMEQEKKISMIVELHFLERIHNCGLNIDTIDETHINVVIKVAELVNAIGQELLIYWEERYLARAPNILSMNEEVSLFTTVLHQLVSIFFKCFAYDDIDVSGAVVPLASRFVLALRKEITTGCVKFTDSIGKDHVCCFQISKHVPQLVSIMYRQMHYPCDFEFDHEDEDDAEEEMYRYELRKLNQKIVNICPELSLQFLCDALSKVNAPLSSALTSDIEAALRLVFHFCEGIRPPPGIKTAMKHDMFREVLLWLHGSDITSHHHREVLILYYDIVVRYCTILKMKPDLLPGILAAMSGTCGIQHSHPRVRSRSCYLLLKLVKAMKSLMRPYVATAIEGIQGLLSNLCNLPLDSDDKLYLFETIGLLLGQTGLEILDEQKYLFSVIKPLIQHSEEVLASRDLQRDPDYFSVILASQIAAIAFLSKVYSRRALPHVQIVLLETVPTSLNVLKSLPTHELVRNKTMIYLQRMILCLGDQILSTMPQFLESLIECCDEKDIPDVAQILYQLCIKLKEKAKPVIDVATLPFLRKCHTLIQRLIADSNPNQLPSHLLTEQFAIQKLIFIFLYQVVSSKCADIFLSATNASSLGDILKTMGDGAIIEKDPAVKRTCLQFFRELVDQWAGLCGGQKENSLSCIDFFKYFFNLFIPGMMECMFNESFDEQDAMQNRNVREMGVIFNLIKQKCSPNEFEQKVVKGILLGYNCPADIISGFIQASNSDQMESCLKALLQLVKHK